MKPITRANPKIIMPIRAGPAGPAVVNFVSSTEVPAAVAIFHLVAEWENKSTCRRKTSGCVLRAHDRDVNNRREAERPCGNLASPDEHEASKLENGHCRNRHRRVAASA